MGVVAMVSISMAVFALCFLIFINYEEKKTLANRKKTSNSL